MDSIADMFTRIRNAYAVSKPTVIVPYSKFKMEIARLLEKEGYLKGVNRKGKKTRKNIELILKYEDGRPAISEIQKISKQSRRIYVSVKEIDKYVKKRGILILTTPKGVLTDKEAKIQNVGGEIIGEVW